MKLSRVTIYILLGVLVTSSLLTTPSGLTSSDPILDVYPTNDVDDGDITMVNLVGSEIQITLTRTLNVNASFLLLFNSNGERVNFEAALLINFETSNCIVYWFIGDMNGIILWQKDITNSRVRTSETTISVWFVEFEDIQISEIFVLSIIPIKNGFYDWSSEIIEFNSWFSIFDSLIAPFKGVPPKIDTTTPTTTTSPVSSTSETTTSDTSTTYDFSSEVTTTSSETSSITETPSQTTTTISTHDTTSDSTTSSELPSDTSPEDSEISSEDETTSGQSITTLPIPIKILFPAILALLMPIYRRKKVIGIE